MTITCNNKERNTVKEMLDNWRENFKKEHPLRYHINNLIDNILFKDIDNIAGYAPHHGLKPWIFIPEIIRQIKWAWQRVFKKYDDTAVWSIDYYIAEQIVKTVSDLRKYGRTIGNCYEDDDFDELGHFKKGIFEQRKADWHNILEKIVEGFSIYPELSERYDYKTNEYQELSKKFEEAFDLFRKYYSALWD